MGGVFRRLQLPYAVYYQQKEMQRPLLLLLLCFTLYVSADNQLALGCQYCFSNSYQICSTVHGAGFNNALVKVNDNSTYCSLFYGQSHVTVDFRCNSKCATGCQVIIHDGAFTNYACSEVGTGRSWQNYLNNWYGRYEGRYGMEKDWCSCGLSKGAIVGIVLGVALLVCIILTVICCCCKNRGGYQ